MKDIFDLIARICLSSIFLFQAGLNIFKVPDSATKIINQGVEAYTEFTLFASLAFLILGGLLVLLGYRPKLGSALLLIYMLTSLLMFHVDLESPEKQLVIMKDITIIGGLLMVMAHGSGKYSVKKILARTTS